MKTLGIIPALFALGLLLIMQFGCHALPQTNLAPFDIEWADGTESKKGEPMFEGPDGKGTANPTAKDGAENPPLPVDDIEKVEEQGEKLKDKASSLPPPFGWILGAVGTAGLAIGGAALRRRRRKAVAAAGGKKKK